MKIYVVRIPMQVWEREMKEREAADVGERN
jgi:hypothetical protein